MIISQDEHFTIQPKAFICLLYNLNKIYQSCHSTVVWCDDKGCTNMVAAARESKSNFS